MSFQILRLLEIIKAGFDLAKQKMNKKIICDLNIFLTEKRKYFFFCFFSVFFLAGRYFDLHCIGRPQYKDFLVDFLNFTIKIRY